jgi:Secretion system C-terminal sorting domain
MIRVTNILIACIVALCPYVLNGQIVLSSIATAEANSKTPDLTDQLEADLMVRSSEGDTATCEAFVKFDISSLDAELIKRVTLITPGGQHNPDGMAMLDPYWIDMYECNTTQWPDPFTWNSTRDMHKGSLLASDNIQGFSYTYTFSDEKVTDYVKSRKADGATEVAFRFHAREIHPFDIWIAGTWEGMKLQVEIDNSREDTLVYGETIGKINFTMDQNYDEADWINVYGSSSFPVDLDGDRSVSVSGSVLLPGSDGESETPFPTNVGGTYNYTNKASTSPTIFSIYGLDPNSKYRLEIFSSRDESDGTDERMTSFHVENFIAQKEGEFVIMDETYIYNDDLSGFKKIQLDMDEVPADWTNPYDFENGQIYERYEILSQPTSQVCALSFGFWQYEGSRETFSSQTLMTGPGSVGMQNTSPSTWWEIDEVNPVDFSKPEHFSGVGVPLWSDEIKLVSPWSSDGDWDKRHLYHPMKVRSTIVAVGEGEVFSGWNYWLDSHMMATVNSVGNKDELLTISPLTPSEYGIITMDMTKLSNNYGYINALIIKKEGATSNKPGISSAGIKCYPVPVTDMLSISNLKGESTITLFDVRGSQVLEVRIEVGDACEIPMDQLEAGIYLLRVYGHESQTTDIQKIIKR